MKPLNGWDVRNNIRDGKDVASIEQTPIDDILGFTSVYELLARNASVWGDAPALLYLEDSNSPAPVTLTHKQFLCRVTQAANSLQSLGVGPSDAVSLLLPGTPEGHIALWASASVARANPINYYLTAPRIAELITAADSSVLILLGHHPELPIWEKLEDILALTPGLKTVIVVNGPSDPQNRIFSFDDLCSAQPGDKIVSPVARQLDDTIALFHTGGTTGAPKLAKHSVRNQLYTAWLMGLMYGTSHTDRVINGLPIYHVAGSLIWGLGSLAAGASLILPTSTGWRNRKLVDNVWDIIDRFQITIAATVPTNVAAMASAHPVGIRKTCLRTVVTGGAPLSRTLADDFEARFGLQVCELFGMTETAGIAAVSPRQRERRSGAAGMRLPHEVIEIKDSATGLKLPPNETGVIHIKGPNVFTGYADAAHNHKLFTEDGFLCSGDVGHLDDEGWLHVTGRQKDLIIRGGHNIDPGIIEDAFFTHPDVSLCAAVGQIDAYAGEVPVAFVVMKQGRTANISELMYHVTARVGEPFARPREIYNVESLPTTAVGKVIKRDLRLQAAVLVFERSLEPVKSEVTLSVAAKYGPRDVIVVEVNLSDEKSPVNRAEIDMQVADLLRPFSVETKACWATPKRN